MIIAIPKETKLDKYVSRTNKSRPDQKEVDIRIRALYNVQEDRLKIANSYESNILVSCSLYNISEAYFSKFLSKDYSLVHQELDDMVLWSIESKGNIPNKIDTESLKRVDKYNNIIYSY